MYYNFSNIRTLCICVVESGPKKFRISCSKSVENTVEKGKINVELNSFFAFGMLRFEKGITKYGKK